jgi:hypothetical protein
MDENQEKEKSLYDISISAFYSLFSFPISFRTFLAEDVIKW